MMMRYTFGEEVIAQRIEAAVRKTLQQGLRTGDIYQAGMQKIGCAAMGDAVVKSL
jgi:3-isopropylmalate dehydrogenase